MTTAIAAECLCGGLRVDLRQCPTHFQLWGSQRLTSVSRIIGATFDREPCELCKGIGFDHKPGCKIGERIENAKLRGREVDELLSLWLTEKIDKIPIGTREDAKALFSKVMDWFYGQTFKVIEVQVLLGCDDHGGKVDLRLDGITTDLKATREVAHTARLQVAAYAALNGSDGAILHVTERIAKPKLVPLEQRDHEDWAILRDHWRMARRRAPKRSEEATNES